ncbi:MAG: DUF3734 domain-containing protein [Bradyrhizobium sp.]
MAVLIASSRQAQTSAEPPCSNEFSRASIEDHWRAGYRDARGTLQSPGSGCPQILEESLIFGLTDGSRN